MKLDKAGLEQLLPHRGDMLLLDEAEVTEPGQSACAVHEVHADAFWVAGHFPGHPIMPGVLVAEAMAQTAAVAALSSADPDKQGKPVFLVGYDKLRFRRPVSVGDHIQLFAELERARRGLYSFCVRAEVSGELVARGELMAAQG